MFENCRWCFLVTLLLIKHIYLHYYEISSSAGLTFHLIMQLVLYLEKVLKDFWKGYLLSYILLNIIKYFFN